MNPAPSRYQSETSKHRDVLSPFCEGYGLDVGFGGDPITPHAVRVDLPQPYAATGDAPVQLGGDCRDLRWFRDDVLDFVYSSHVLEDFPEQQTESVMREWVRVLKPGGNLVVLLPDQARYMACCRRTGQPSNEHHSIDHFSLDYVSAVASRLGNLERAAVFPELGEYSFGVVFRKTLSSTGNSDRVTDLEGRLMESYRERDRLQLLLNRIQNRPAYRFARGIWHGIRRLTG